MTVATTEVLAMIEKEAKRDRKRSNNTYTHVILWRFDHPFCLLSLSGALSFLTGVGSIAAHPEERAPIVLPTEVIGAKY